MGDTTKVIGQQEVGRCPSWRHHPWNSVNGSFAITGSNCIRWSNSAPGTASVGRPATSGSIASRTVPRDSHGQRGVTNAGTIRLKRKLLFIANALKQHPIGLEEVDDGIWSIHFCNVLLGRVDERDYTIRA